MRDFVVVGVVLEAAGALYGFDGVIYEQGVYLYASRAQVHAVLPYVERGAQHGQFAVGIIQHQVAFQVNALEWTEKPAFAGSTSLEIFQDAFCEVVHEGEVEAFSVYPQIKSVLPLFVPDVEAAFYVGVVIVCLVGNGGVESKPVGLLSPCGMCL